MAGRPTDYNPEIADKICLLISTTTFGLSTICKGEDMPHRATIYRWLVDHKEFRDNYARAKEQQADLMAEEILDISDNEDNDMIAGAMGMSGNATAVARARLRVDSRKWLMSKLLPKKYGDKVEQTLIGDPENPIKTESKHEVVFIDMTKR